MPLLGQVPSLETKKQWQEVGPKRTEQLLHMKERREEQSPEEGDDQTQPRSSVYVSRQSDGCSSQGEDRKRQGKGNRV